MLRKKLADIQAVLLGEQLADELLDFIKIACARKCE
jgi:hypothetical protein